jgi:DedD protein
VPAAPGSAADAAAVAADTGTATAAAPASDAAGSGAASDHPSSTANPVRIFVQAAALSKESAARELAARLRKSGMAPFVERAESNGSTRYRVRLGPFASRDEAERVRARLRALGVNSSLLGA